MMSPRADPEERRAEIIDAAMRCFARKGYHGTSMDDIVAESGLSKGTLYWYFDSKRALFVALMESFFTPFVDALNFLTDLDGTASERLRWFGSRMHEAFDREMITLIIDFWAQAPQDAELNQLYREFYLKFTQQLAMVIQQGIDRGEFIKVDAHEVAMGLSALYDGVLFHDVLLLPGDISRRMTLLTDLVTRGLRVNQEDA